MKWKCILSMWKISSVYKAIKVTLDECEIIIACSTIHFWYIMYLWVKHFKHYRLSAYIIWVWYSNSKNTTIIFKLFKLFVCVCILLWIFFAEKYVGGISKNKTCDDNHVPIVAIFVNKTVFTLKWNALRKKCLCL